MNMRPGLMVTSAALCALLGSPAAAARDLYVKQLGGNDANDGLTWGSAVATIQYALNLAQGLAGADTVHVAAGTYAEHVIVGTNDVRLLGSYPPGGPGPRNRLATPSIVDGSLSGITIEVNSASNVVIDGFVVTRGYNNYFAPGSPGGPGGGVAIFYANGVSLSNNTIEGNQASYGAGVGAVGSFGVSLTGNLIRDNAGGLLAAIGDGGGVAIYHGSAVVQGNTVTGNSTPGRGGGLQASDSVLTLSRNLIQGNGASDGGGVVVADCATAVAADNTIRGNHADWDGGGVYLPGPTPCPANKTIRLVRNKIQGNEATNWGGGLCILYGAHPEALINNLITDNVSHAYGGGISLYDQSSAVIVNNTLANNSAYGGGHALYVHTGTSATISNSILWGSQAAVLTTDGGTARVTWSDVRGGWPGAGNINANPRFISATDYHLGATSPAKDKGTRTGAPANDLDSKPRPQGPGVDMGAYEVQVAPPVSPRPIPGVRPPVYWY